MSFDLQPLVSAIKASSIGPTIKVFRYKRISFLHSSLQQQFSSFAALKASFNPLISNSFIFVSPFPVCKLLPALHSCLGYSTPGFPSATESRLLFTMLVAAYNYHYLQNQCFFRI